MCLLSKRGKIMKSIPFVLTLLLLSALQASAANNIQIDGTGPASIAELHSDIESFDVTLYSTQPEKNLTLETSLVRSENGNEEVIATQEFLTGSLPADTGVTKVGFWDVRNPERGAYTLRAKLMEQEQVLSEAEYDFVYGSYSASRLHVDDLVSNSEGISVVLSPNQASLFDIEYMLVNGHDVIYETKTEKASLTSVPETFSASWGTLLENNKQYDGRVKVHVYSPDQGFIVSTESFTARDDAEITDIYEDETGASATVLGRSQVPFEGSLIFSVYKVQDTSGQGSSVFVESVRERVPVLLTDDDETVEVAWKDRLTEGVYRLEIELIGNDGDVIKRRETIIESDLSPVNENEAGTDTGNETSEEEDGKGITGSSVIAGTAGLAMVFAFFKNQNKKSKRP
jgi:methionine-rich copper-binding protein CopC